MKARRRDRRGKKDGPSPPVLSARASSVARAPAALRDGRDAPAAATDAAAPPSFSFARVPIFAPRSVTPTDGSRVPDAVRRRTEATTGADVSGVRIHTGSESAMSASSLGARAYTVGGDVHFGAGQYRPGTPQGDRLIAHELVHTIQQTGGPATAHALEVSAPGDVSELEADAVADRIVEGRGLATVSQRGGPRVSCVVWEDTERWLNAHQRRKAPPPEWNAAYGPTAGKRLAAQRGAIGKDKKHPALASASSQGGSKLDMTRPLTLADLEYIYIPATGVPKKEAAEIRATLPSRVDHLNNAFRAMEIDTAEAQAAFIAHSYAESWQLRRFKAQADPAVVGEFPGRGPLQTTYRQGYIKSLAYLEAQAERLQRAGATDPQKAADAQLARDALAAIKRDPAAAEDPRYAFMLSAAMMHGAGGVAATAKLKGVDPTFPGNASEDYWMTSGVDIAAKIVFWEDMQANGASYLAAAEAELKTASGDDKVKKEKKRDRIAAQKQDAPERVKYWRGVRDAAARKDAAYDRAMVRLRPRILKPATPPPASPSAAPGP